MIENIGYRISDSCGEDAFIINANNDEDYIEIKDLAGNPSIYICQLEILKDTIKCLKQMAVSMYWVESVDDLDLNDD